MVAFHRSFMRDVPPDAPHDLVPWKGLFKMRSGPDRRDEADHAQNGPVLRDIDDLMNAEARWKPCSSGKVVQPRGPRPQTQNGDPSGRRSPFQ